MTDEEPSTKATTPLRNFEADRDSEETKDEVFGNDDLTLHASPRKDTNVESNFEEIRIPDDTVNASDVDTNIDSSEPIITSIP